MGFFENEFLGNELWRWLAYAGIVLVVFMLSKSVAYFFRVVAKTVTKRTTMEIDDLILDAIQKPIALGILLSGIYFGLFLIEFDGVPVANSISNIFAGAVTLIIVSVLARLYGDLLDHYLRPITEKTETKLDDQLLPIAIKGGRFLIWALGLVLALDEFGLEVTSLIAGLGIGGLALAMAAKDTVANVFGGASIFADKPFEIGDTIELGGKQGVVEEIGVRTTRLRTFDDTVFIMPNAKVSDGPIENLSRRRRRRFLADLGLTYDTTPEQLDQAKAILKEIIEETDGIDDDFTIRFDGFGDFALFLKLIYWVHKPSDFFGTRAIVNEKILRRFNEAGIEMAFPTQTIQLVK